MEKMQYKLEMFEGPLDLLLHLIKKNKVSICDIPIAEITDQYMQIINEAADSDLDGMSEFLVMASQLLYIKSRMLLPKKEEEEEEDPREDLARRLEEYQQYKEASKSLRKSEFSSRYLIFREAEKLELPVPPYSRSHETEELLEAFAMMLDRRQRRQKPEKRAFSGIVGREKVSVEDMAEKVRKCLQKKGRVSFSSLFRPEDTKPEMIATFLALLEMIKLSRIRAEYNEDRHDLIIVQSEG